MISCCSCFGTKTTSKDEGITIGDKEDPIILQPKVSVKVSILFHTLAWLSGLALLCNLLSVYRYLVSLLANELTFYLIKQSSYISCEHSFIK